MAYVSRSRWRSWHQQGGIIEGILDELECSETEHFRYHFGGTKSAKYKITLNGDREVRIKMSSYLHGADILPELNGWYSDSDTDEQKRMKSLRYILAKAYYRLCCKLIQIPCSKQDQHNKSIGFAVGRVDIYQHLLKRKADCGKKRKQREELKRKKNMANRFQLMEFEE